LQPTEARGLELFPSLAAKEKPPLTIVGDVSGRIAIMVVRHFSIAKHLQSIYSSTKHN
jgi:hypothetical protein